MVPINEDEDEGDAPKEQGDAPDDTKIQIHVEPVETVESVKPMEQVEPADPNVTTEAAPRASVLSAPRASVLSAHLGHAARSRASRNRLSEMQAVAMKSSRHVLEHRKRKGSIGSENEPHEPEDKQVSAVLSQVEAAKSSLVTAQEEHLQHLAEMAADVARSEQIIALTEELVEQSARPKLQESEMGQMTEASEVALALRQRLSLEEDAHLSSLRQLEEERSAQEETLSWARRLEEEHHEHRREADVEQERLKAEIAELIVQKEQGLAYQQSEQRWEERCQQAEDAHLSSQRQLEEERSAQEETLSWAGRLEEEHHERRREADVEQERLKAEIAELIVQKEQGLAYQQSEQRWEERCQQAEDAHLSSQRQLEEERSAQEETLSWAGRLEEEHHERRREADVEQQHLKAEIAELIVQKEQGLAYQQQSAQRAQELELLQQDLAAKVQDRQRWEERCQQAEAQGTAAEAKHFQAEEGRAKLEEEMAILRKELVAQEELLRQESIEHHARLAEEEQRNVTLTRTEEECRTIFENLEVKLEQHGSSPTGGKLEELDDDAQGSETEAAQAFEARVHEEMKSLRRTETDLRRAIAAHRYVVRHMINDKPLLPSPVATRSKALADEEEKEEKTVKLSSPPSARASHDFLFGLPAKPMPASAVAWLRGTSEEEESL